MQPPRRPRTRLSAGQVANVVAWCILGGLAALAVVLVTWVGPFGLVLLGLLTMVVCTQFSMDEFAPPSWSIAALRARLTAPTSPEQQAAIAAERHITLSPGRFYFRCGAVLVVAGLAGVAWQFWG